MSPRSNLVRELFWCITALVLGVSVLSLTFSNTLLGPERDGRNVILAYFGFVLSVAATVGILRGICKNQLGDASSLTRRTFRAATSLAARTARGVNRAGDVVRDSILDWSLEEEPAASPREPLPPLDPRKFATALRRPAAKAMGKVAAILNEAEDVEAMTACQEEVRAVVEELVRQALARAEQMRLDAAVAAMAVPMGPHGRWVEKYRRMRVTDGRVSEPRKDPAPCPSPPSAAAKSVEALTV